MFSQVTDRLELQPKHGDAVNSTVSFRIEM